MRARDTKATGQEACRTRDPKTKEEWQEAVDAASACRAIADCKAYGLLDGGPVINAERCDEILTRGAALGVMPTAPAKELAVELIASLARAASA